MKKLAMLFSVIFLMTAIGTATAQEKGTSAEAKAMVKKAVAYVKKVGEKRALAEFQKPKSSFVHKDLYIFATSLEGVALAHPMTPGLVGKNLMALKDADGKMFVKERNEIARTKGGGTITYRWTNHQTKKVELKETYFELVPGTNVILNCGYYK